ncbi:MAG TPA: T9SS type A sorting domain-containing protein [Flavobacterium sp.]|jgi:uncharacterized repeat protein (TIGR01451 family)
MIRKLLHLLVILTSFQSFSQAVAYPAQDLTSCDVFDLTVQNAVVLGDQNPAIFGVAYHHSAVDAQNVMNEIVNPSAYGGFDNEIIYASVYSSIDQTVAITSFHLVNPTPEVLDFPNVTACDSYFLPTLPPGMGYFSAPGGAAPIPSAVLTSSQTVYVFAQEGNCTAEASFEVIMNLSPPTLSLVDVSVCDFYILPVLPPGYAYSTGPNGMGNLLMPGYIITSTQEIYVFGQFGLCTSEETFMVTISGTPATPVLSDVVSCGPYTLPALPAGQSYHSAPGGSQSTALTNPVITESVTLYVFAQSSTVPNCTSEASFHITIGNGNPQDPIEDVVACHSYILPTLPPEGSYSFNGTPLTGTEPFVITQTGVVTLYVAGTCQQSFYVVIHDVTPDTVAPIQGCDEDGDGIGTFNLDISATGLSSIELFEIAFFETLGSAEAGLNQIVPQTYVNTVPYTQTIYVKISSSPDCYSITPVTLTTIQCNSISGTIRIDTDNNGCSASDAPLANQQVVCDTENGQFYAYTNDEGMYTFNNITEGNAGVYPFPVPAGMIASPASYEFDIAGEGATLTADICLSSPPPFIDAIVELYPMSNPVPGFNTHYIMRVRNSGTMPVSGTATFNYNSALVTFSSASTAPLSQSSTSVTFSFADLAVYSSIDYLLTLTVYTPPTVNAGQVVFSNATVTINQSDSNLVNNTAGLTQVVTNSFDPNDITVHEGEFITEAQADDYLHYTIRFQNTGNSDAVNVRLENTLDHNLDWSTFVPLTGSHSYQAERSNDGQVTFRFNNINLPGSQEDEPGSHGYVSYKIKPVSGFDVGDIISNTAEIYFDYNLPIVTNTVTTQIQQLSVRDNDFATWLVYPNPVNDIVNIHFADAGRVMVSVVDLQGKVILLEEKVLQNGDAQLDVSNIQSGMYFVYIASGEQDAVVKAVVKLIIR